jgi:hypothetical protein
MRSPKNKLIKVGTYQLGYRWVDVFLDPKYSGGSFDFMPGWGPNDPKVHSEMIVGCDHAAWKSWGVLAHEAMEAVMSDMGLRFNATVRICPNSSDNYTFIFDHAHFTEVAARVGAFISEAGAEFSRAVEKLREEVKKPKPTKRKKAK